MESYWFNWNPNFILKERQEEREREKNVELDPPCKMEHVESKEKATIAQCDTALVYCHW